MAIPSFRWREAWRRIHGMVPVVLRFVLFGVLTGGGVFWTAYDMLHGSYRIEDWSAAWVILLRMLLTVMPPFGFLTLLYASVPAIATGVLYVLFLRRFTHGNPPLLVRALLGAALGASVTTLIPLVVGLPLGAYREWSSLRFLIPTTAAGGLAATLAAASIGRRAYLAATRGAGRIASPGHGAA